MTIPASASYFDNELDPTDLADPMMDMSPLLEDGEAFASWNLVVPPESELFGLSLGTGSYQSAIVDNILIIWPSIAPGNRDDEEFLQGVNLPLEFNCETDNIPPRRFQRTLVLRVKQQ